MQWLHELVAWWSSLPASAVFFFTIPLAVAAAALLADAFAGLRGRH